MFKKVIAFLVIVCFSTTFIQPWARAGMDKGGQLNSTVPISLPAPGTMVNLSSAYEPALIKGLTVHQDNPFLFDFIVDTGNSQLTTDDQQLKTEGDRLIKYFFACLTIPEKDLWVNLSPYEKNKMIPQALGQTALGRDLLAQDYILKQLTASLIYPEKDLGKKFWGRVYTKAQQLYGTAQVPVNTFNKVWVLADKATVYEHGQTAFVVGGHLKVMLEEDYLALNKRGQLNSTVPISSVNAIGSQIVRDLILPEIEHEVNTGKNFATLRQIFNSQILATWYKKNLKEALLNQVYADKSTVKGVNLNDPSVKEQIYQQYLKAYKKGVFNYIKEETDNSLPQSGEGQGGGSRTIPRKYFSGGYGSDLALTVKTDSNSARAVQLTPNTYRLQTLVGLNGASPAMTSPDAAMTAGLVEDAAMMVSKEDEARRFINSSKNVVVKEEKINRLIGLFNGQNIPAAYVAAEPKNTKFGRFEFAYKHYIGVGDEYKWVWPEMRRGEIGLYYKAGGIGSGTLGVLIMNGRQFVIFIADLLKRSPKDARELVVYLSRELLGGRVLTRSAQTAAKKADAVMMGLRLGIDSTWTPLSFPNEPSASFDLYPGIMGVQLDLKNDSTTKKIFLFVNQSLQLEVREGSIFANSIIKTNRDKYPVSIGNSTISFEYESHVVRVNIIGRQLNETVWMKRSVFFPINNVYPQKIVVSDGKSDQEIPNKNGSVVHFGSRDVYVEISGGYVRIHADGEPAKGESAIAVKVVDAAMTTAFDEGIVTLEKVRKLRQRINDFLKERSNVFVMAVFNEGQQDPSGFTFGKPQEVQDKIGIPVTIFSNVQTALLRGKLQGELKRHNLSFPGTSDEWNQIWENPWSDAAMTSRLKELDKLFIIKLDFLQLSEHVWWSITRDLEGGEVSHSWHQGQIYAGPKTSYKKILEEVKQIIEEIGDTPSEVSRTYEWNGLEAAASKYDTEMKFDAAMMTVVEPNGSNFFKLFGNKTKIERFHVKVGLDLSPGFRVWKAWNGENWEISTPSSEYVDWIKPKGPSKSLFMFKERGRVIIVKQRPRNVPSVELIFDPPETAGDEAVGMQVINGTNDKVSIIPDAAMMALDENLLKRIREAGLNPAELLQRFQGQQRGQQEGITPVNNPEVFKAWVQGQIAIAESLKRQHPGATPAPRSGSADAAMITFLERFTPEELAAERQRLEGLKKQLEEPMLHPGGNEDIITAALNDVKAELEQVKQLLLTKNKDQAQTALPPGGIDLNAANMGLSVTKDADGGVKVNFDPAMIERIKTQGVQSVVPVIINVIPMTPAQIRPLLGMPPVKEEEFAALK